MRYTPFLLFLGLLAGCGFSPTAPDDRLPVELQFGVFRVAALAPFFAQGADGSVLIGGTFQTPCSPYEATAQATLEGSTVVLRVIGRNENDCPQDVVASVLYDAVVRDLSPGDYRVRIVHEWTDVNWPYITAFETDITVR